MSLIADALKRAQEQRSESRGGKDADDKARRLLSGSAPLRVETRDGLAVPRSVAIAGTVLVAAVATFGAVVWLTPRAEVTGDTGVALSNRTAASDPAPASVEADPGVNTVQDRLADAGAAGPARGTDATGGVGGSEANGAMGGAGGPGTLPAAGTEGGGDAEEGRTGDPAGPGDAADGPGGASGAASSGAAAEPSSFRLTLQGQAAAEAMDASELFGRAISAQQRGDLRGAASLYRRAIQRNPGDAQLHNNLGTVYRALRMPGEAMAAFRTAVDVDPGYAPAWSNLGIMLDGAGRTEEAIDAFREAIRRDPSNDGARVNLANSYMGMGLVEDARSLLQEVLRDSPALPEAHYAMARVLETVGETDRAVRHYQLFLDLAGGQFPALEARVEGHLSDLEGGT